MNRGGRFLLLGGLIALCACAQTVDPMRPAVPPGTYQVQQMVRPTLFPSIQPSSLPGLRPRPPIGVRSPLPPGLLDRTHRLSPEQQVLAVANRTRVQQGMSTLTSVPRLNTQAYALAYAASSLNSDYDARRVQEGLAQEGIQVQAAEANIARVEASSTAFARDAVAHWMRYPHTRRNLLNPDFTQTGIAVIKGTGDRCPGCWFIAQIYVRP